MAGTLTIRHIIPTSEGRFDPYVTFNRWLPSGEKDALIRTRDNFTARLWIDKSCVESPSPLTEEYISEWVNICVNKIYVDVEVQNVPEDLITFIYDERDRPKGEIHHGIKPKDKDYNRLGEAYKELGKEVLKMAIEGYNRFIIFSRNNKGQYWLSERSFDVDRISSSNVEFNSKVRSNSYKWVRWCPPFTDTITVQIPDNEPSIRRDEWEQIKEFVKSNSRSNLVLELLANAQSLLDNNHRRSAIIEVISALEVSVHEFAKSPRTDDLFPNSNIRKRIHVNNLKSQVKHIGLSLTVNYLLPILFPSDILPIKVLNQCQKAIDLRNNIVHNGSRDVKEALVRPLIYAVIKTCKILIKYTEEQST